MIIALGMKNGIMYQQNWHRLITWFIGQGAKGITQNQFYTKSIEIHTQKTQIFTKLLV